MSTLPAWALIVHGAPGAITAACGATLWALLLIAGIAKCIQIMRRPATDYLCVLSLAMALAGVLGCTLLGTVAEILTVGMAAPIRVALALCATVVFSVIAGALVVGIIGLTHYARHKAIYNQGHAQAAWGVGLSTAFLALAAGGAVWQVLRTVPDAHLQIRQTPEELIKFEDLNFSIQAPEKPWRRLDVQQINRAATVGFMLADPPAVFFVIGEKAGLESEVTKEALAAVCEAHLRGAASAVELGRRSAETIDGIEGLRFTAGANVAGRNTAYSYWVAVHNGYAWQLITYGSERFAADVRKAADELSRRFKVLDRERVCHTISPSSRDLAETKPATTEDHAGGCKSAQPAVAAGAPPIAADTKPTASLLECRRSFRTRLVARESLAPPLEEPPPELFRTVYYDAPIGPLAAYLSVPPEDGRRYPAIVWIHGGECNSLGPVWFPPRPENDQTGSAFWKAGIVTLYPTLRGGNGGPGTCEAFLGEVDDLLAAADYLAGQDFVDPQRLYLGGHSTGGTLALLAAACPNRFRAVLAFGPVSNVAGYSVEYLPFDLSDPREIELRSPIYWLDQIRTPTFVLEGKLGPSNLASLLSMSEASHNPALVFLPVDGGNHYSILWPITRLAAREILADAGETTNINFTEMELTRAMHEVSE